MAWTCDKIEMKSHVSTLGTGVQIPKTLWSGTNILELSLLKFPERWILKANHRSQCVYIGRGQIGLKELKSITRGWLDHKEYNLLGEWAYSKAAPLILLEEWIGDGPVPPTDYKFYTFGNSVGMILATQGRFHDEKTVIYDKDWKSLNIAKGPSAWEGDLPKPAHLDKMVEIAEVIGQEFDFMRVDLFDTNTGVYFGETTPYPGGGLTAFEPREFDLLLGDKWILPD